MDNQIIIFFIALTLLLLLDCTCVNGKRQSFTAGPGGYGQMRRRAAAPEPEEEAVVNNKDLKEDDLKKKGGSKKMSKKKNNKALKKDKKKDNLKTTVKDILAEMQGKHIKIIQASIDTRMGNMEKDIKFNTDRTGPVKENTGNIGLNTGNIGLNTGNIGFNTALMGSFSSLPIIIDAEAKRVAEAEAKLVEEAINEPELAEVYE